MKRTKNKIKRKEKFIIQRKIRLIIKLHKLLIKFNCKIMHTWAPSPYTKNTY